LFELIDFIFLCLFNFYDYSIFRFDMIETVSGIEAN